MSLATRCPACGTIFRVVQDQLKVSEGWVRCGQCQEVFHGIESLFELGSEPGEMTRASLSDTAPTAAPASGSMPPPIAATRPSTAMPTSIVSPEPPSMPAASMAGVLEAAAADTSRVVVSTPVAVPRRGMSPTFAARVAARMAEDAARARALAAGSPSVAESPPGVEAPDDEAPAAVVTDGPVAEDAITWLPDAPAQDVPPSTAEIAPAAPAPAGLRDTEPREPLATQDDGRESAVTEGPESLLEGSDFVAAEVPAVATEPDPTVEAAPPSAHHASSSPGDGTPQEEAPTAPVPLQPRHDDIEETEPMPLPDLAAEGAVPSESGSTVDGTTDASADAAFSHPADPAPGDAELPPSHVDSPAEADVARSLDEHADAGRSPSLDELALAEADSPDDDDEDGGPHTLAAMLPEPVDEWPPRRRRQRKTPLPAIEARHREAAERADPRFVREARRGERWTRPWVRATLSVLLFVLVLAAAAQVAWPLRDVIAARWPDTAPALELACEQAGCKVEAPRSLSSLALDGSSLTRTDADHVLLFSADLHNRSDRAVRMPSFDLSFTDLNGQVVARKVLAPSEIGIRQTSLAPEAELHVHARLQITGVDATGFQADMFYP